MKQHYKINIQGSTEDLENKLEEYFRKNSVADHKLSGVGNSGKQRIITLHNGVTIIYERGIEHTGYATLCQKFIEMYISSTKEYIMKAVDELKRYISADKITIENLT